MSATIADKLTYLAGTKTAIKEAIEAKNVEVGGIPFRQYADKIALIEGGGGEPEPYVRPADWLTLPTLTEGQQKFVGLHAVYPESNFVAFQCSGAYTVDWGDGSNPENFANNATAYHVFDYANFSANTYCDRGYRQAIITITPQDGQNLTSIDLNIKHNQSGLQAYTQGWLDIRVAGSNLTKCGWSSSTTVRRGLLEQYEFVGSNNIINFSYMFYYCYSLQSIPQLDTSSGNNFTYMLGYCYSLQSIPQLDTSQGTTFNSMFYYCYSLQSIPQLDTSQGTTFNSMFGSCYSLQSIPQLDTSQGTTFNSMFYSCYSLQSIPQLDTSQGTTFRSMFHSCYSLQSIPQLDTSQGTDFSYMFNYCYSLQSIPQLDTSQGTTFRSMFGYCSSLQSIPQLDTSQGTTFSGMFSNCSSLSAGKLLGTKITISYSGCKLSRAALVDIFGGLASGVSGQTITITDNWGAQYLTAEDREIATNKGWTISG